MNTNFINRKKAGFTLIELIVVIAIIGLLASLVTASLVKSRSRAEVTKVAAEYKSVASALELYRQTNGGYPGNEGEAMNISTLAGNLSAYIQQIPSVSPTVVIGSSVYYYLNPKDGSDKFLCGSDASQNQDYVIYFDPTAEAEDSGLFKPLYLSGSRFNPYLCVSVNQN